MVLPTPVWVIGSYDTEGKPNVMTAAWVGICCSSPPCLMVSLREATYTYGNIMKREAFTVNIPTSSYLKETDYFGIVSGRDEDKFSVSGLTPEKSNIVDAPYVKEFPINIECQLVHTYKAGLHTLFIGEIKDVKANSHILGEHDTPDIEKLRPFIFTPGNKQYYATGKSIGEAFSIGRAIKNGE